MKVIFYLFFWTISIISSNNVDPNPPFSLVVFEGSDWCKNCMKLEHNVLSNSEFLDFLSEKNISLNRIDFPRWIKQSEEIVEKNNALAEQYNFDGAFPTIILTSEATDEYIQISHHKQASLNEITKQIDSYLSSKPK